MKFFTCKKVDYPPYLKFDCCARDERELLDRQLGAKTREELTLNEGVFREDDIPELENGIYPVDYSNGGFVARSREQLFAAEMEQRGTDRRRYVGACDRQVGASIGEGFEFDGCRFSLSPHAQLNWLRIGLSCAQGAFREVDVPTADDKLYRLTADRVEPFCQAFSKKVESCLLNNAKFNE